MINKILGSRIREERERLGLSQSELAQKINVSGKSVISNYETGFSQPGIDVVDQFATIFNCTTDYLLGRTSVPRTEQPPKPEEEDELNFKLVSLNDGEYGQKPPEGLEALIRKIVREEREIARKKK